MRITIFFICSICIPLKQGLRRQIRESYTQLHKFHLYSIKTRIKTRYRTARAGAPLFHLYSIKTRIKTAQRACGWPPWLCSICIPLKQGLRRCYAGQVGCRNSFHLYSIKTRIKTGDHPFRRVALRKSETIIHLNKVIGSLTQSWLFPFVKQPQSYVSIY